MAEAVEEAARPPRGAKSAEAFRTISEVAGELDVPQHVLRFWEGKFTQIRPLKRGGGRRYYRPEDLELLRRIRQLLYVQGYTIKGVQRLLRERGRNPPPVEPAKQVPQAKPADATAGRHAEETTKLASDMRLKRLLSNLQELSELLRQPRR